MILPRRSIFIRPPIHRTLVLRVRFARPPTFRYRIGQYGGIIVVQRELGDDEQGKLEEGCARAREEERKRETRRCRITTGIVKSRHGEEKEKTATGVKECIRTVVREWKRRIRWRKDRQDSGDEPEAEEGEM